MSPRRAIQNLNSYQDSKPKGKLPHSYLPTSAPEERGPDKGNEMKENIISTTLKKEYFWLTDFLS
jgi:hypothetical protein